MCMVMVRELLVFKHAGINVLIVKDLGKTARRNPIGHLNASTGILECVPCF